MRRLRVEVAVVGVTRTGAGTVTKYRGDARHCPVDVSELTH